MGIGLNILTVRPMWINALANLCENALTYLFENALAICEKMPWMYVVFLFLFLCIISIIIVYS